MNYFNLWSNSDDTKLLERIFAEKRESRMARERSEDAVIRNVFRYLEKSNFLKDHLDFISRSGNENARIIYRSFDSKAGGPWEPLVLAREEFEEKDNAVTDWFEGGRVPVPTVMIPEEPPDVSLVR